MGLLNWLKIRLKFSFGIFITFLIVFVVHNLDCLPYHDVVCVIVVPLMASAGITYCTNRYLKDIAKTESRDDLEKIFRDNFRITSQMHRTEIRDNIVSSKTIVEESIKDSTRTIKQLRDEQVSVFAKMKTTLDRWNSLMKLFGEDNG